MLHGARASLFIFILLNLYIDFHDLKQIIKNQPHFHHRHNNHFSLDENTLIRKPLEKLCDTPVEEAPFLDQLNTSCPLPYKSSSLVTGCLCDYESETIKCIHINRLNQFPQFEAPLDESSFKWNIDLKCRNFNNIIDFKAFLPLKTVNILDLSMPNESFTKSQCQSEFSLEQALIHTITSNHTIDRRINNDLLSRYFDTHSLIINNLILDDNKIKNLFLNENFYLTSTGVQSGTIIRNISLKNNHIERLNTRKNLDICTFKTDSVDLAFNQLKQIDVEFLIFLNYLNVSNNIITTFGIDFFEKSNYDTTYFHENCMKHMMQHAANSTKPKKYQSRLRILDFSNNYLSRLPFIYLKSIDFKQLQSFNLSTNYLRHLNEGEFASMKNLKHLSLRGNLLERLELRSLHGLLNLRTLDLSYNLLRNLPANLLFDQSKTMEYLYLNHNNLTQVPKEALRLCTSVKYLYLNENRIKRIENYSFGFMCNLIELYLAHNQIEFIDLNAFLIDEQSIIGPGLIEKLDLSYNRLTYLNSSIFSYLTNLRHLMLNNNMLGSIDISVFKGINYLISLDLSLNNLRNLNFLANKNFSSLRYLKLSNNQISSLIPGQFVYLVALNTLDLSSNRIRTISDCAFYGLEHSIRRLILNYNQITQLNSCAFSIKFRTLRFVQILHNPLNCTDSCDFFFTVYNEPYSIKYEGFECSSSNGDGSRYAECTVAQYEKIYQKCRRRIDPSNCIHNLIGDMLSNKLEKEDQSVEDSVPSKLLNSQTNHRPSSVMTVTFLIIIFTVNIFG